MRLRGKGEWGCRWIYRWGSGNLYVLTWWLLISCEGRVKAMRRNRGGWSRLGGSGKCLVSCPSCSGLTLAGEWAPALPLQVEGLQDDSAARHRVSPQAVSLQRMRMNRLQQGESRVEMEAWSQERPGERKDSNCCHNNEMKLAEWSQGESPFFFPSTDRNLLSQNLDNNTRDVWGIGWVRREVPLF